MLGKNVTVDRTIVANLGTKDIGTVIRIVSCLGFPSWDVIRFQMTTDMSYMAQRGKPHYQINWKPMMFYIYIFFIGLVSQNNNFLQGFIFLLSNFQPKHLDFSSLLHINKTDACVRQDGLWDIVTFLYHKQRYPLMVNNSKIFKTNSKILTQ